MCVSNAHSHTIRYRRTHPTVVICYAPGGMLTKWLISLCCLQTGEATLPPLQQRTRSRRERGHPERATGNFLWTLCLVYKSQEEEDFQISRGNPREIHFNHLFNQSDISEKYWAAKDNQFYLLPNFRWLINSKNGGASDWNGSKGIPRTHWVGSIFSIWPWECLWIPPGDEQEVVSREDGVQAT